jgi:hypothetical protein
MTTTTLDSCIANAVLHAMLLSEPPSKKHPYVSAYTAIYDDWDGGIIHILGFGTDKRGDYAVYGIFTESKKHGKFYLDRLADFQEPLYYDDYYSDDDFFSDGDEHCSFYSEDFLGFSGKNFSDLPLVVGDNRNWGDY